MICNDMLGWRVAITTRSQTAELRILGPGDLHIVIPNFSTEKPIYESSVILDDDSSIMGIIGFTYPFPEGESDLNLGIYYVGDPPDAFLSMGSAFWGLPMEFAQLLFRVFLLG